MNSGKIYVRVSAEFDRQGFVYPRAITWTDGRTYEIDKVLEVKHMYSSKAGGDGDRFTIMVSGQMRYLFYERTAELQGNHLGRWFVEGQKTA